MTGTPAVKPVVYVVEESASKFPQAISPPRLSTKLIAITPVPAPESSEYYIVWRKVSATVKAKEVPSPATPGEDPKS